MGGSVYLDGVLDGFKSITEALSFWTVNVLSCSEVYAGDKNGAGTYPLNADLDEMKYFYQALPASGKWQLEQNDIGSSVSIVFI